MFRYKFLDKRFPPDERSLGSWRGKPRFDVIWVRARDYCGNQLFQDGGIHPQDVAQGRVGDCWLIAAIACVAAHEPQILRRAFVTKQTNRRGKYQVRIFDRSARAWEVVSIDENIPLQRSSRAPIFAQSLIMWVVLLEKGAHPGSCTDPPAASLASPRATRATRPRRAPASHVPLCIDVRARARLASPRRCAAFAKFCGGWDRLDGGHVAWALNALTGDPVFRLKRYDFAGGAWRRLDVTMHSRDGKKSMGASTSLDLT
jgi:hypothetical protein